LHDEIVGEAIGSDAHTSLLFEVDDRVEHVVDRRDQFG
jgi:hypothetical protein